MSSRRARRPTSAVGWSAERAAAVGSDEQRVGDRLAAPAADRLAGPGDVRGEASCRSCALRGLKRDEDGRQRAGMGWERTRGELRAATGEQHDAGDTGEGARRARRVLQAKGVDDVAGAGAPPHDGERARQPRRGARRRELRRDEKLTSIVMSICSACRANRCGHEVPAASRSAPTKISPRPTKTISNGNRQLALASLDVVQRGGVHTCDAKRGPGCAPDRERRDDQRRADDEHRNPCPPRVVAAARAEERG